MNASTTRRQLIGSAVALRGATEPTERLRMNSEVGFPVQLPADLILLDNLCDPRWDRSAARVADQVTVI